MLPKSSIKKLIGDYHQYDIDFEDDAKLSSDSFLTPLLDNRPRSRTDYEDPDSIEIKVNNTVKRLEKIKKSECSICLFSLNEKPYTEPVQELKEFAKTPCKHRFHKTCLMGWMHQKY